MLLRNGLSLLFALCFSLSSFAVNAITIGGTINDLQGDSVQLFLNGVPEFFLAGGSFTFQQQLDINTPYSITVGDEPSRYCSVIGGVGITGDGESEPINVTTVKVRCGKNFKEFPVNISLIITELTGPTIENPSIKTYGPGGGEEDLKWCGKFPQGIQEINEWNEDQLDMGGSLTVNKVTGKVSDFISPVRLLDGRFDLGFSDEVPDKLHMDFDRTIVQDAKTETFTTVSDGCSDGIGARCISSTGTTDRSYRFYTTNQGREIKGEAFHTYTSNETWTDIWGGENSHTVTCTVRVKITGSRTDLGPAPKRIEPSSLSTLKVLLRNNIKSDTLIKTRTVAIGRRG